MADIRKRVNDLLRLAGDENTTEAERVAAALEAARLAKKHNLGVEERPKDADRRQRQPGEPPRRAPPPPPPPPPRSRPVYQHPPYFGDYEPYDEREIDVFVGHRRFYGSGSDWTRVSLRHDQNVTCCVCKKPILEDECFFDASIGYRHYDITCDQP